MDVYLVRHCQTCAPLGACYGQTDVPLAPDWQQQLPSIQCCLPSTALVFSSPLSRCLQLALALTDDVHIDDRLLELNFGAWENRLFSALPQAELRDWCDHYVDTAPPGGESYRQLQQRVFAFYQDLTALNAASVVIVTHAGVIRALSAIHYGLTAEQAFELTIKFASVHRLTL